VAGDERNFAGLTYLLLTYTMSHKTDR
jgi:hypothetical protein